MAQNLTIEIITLLFTMIIIVIIINTDLCPPDTYSSDGFVNSVCINCTNSTYQPDYGSTSCICCG